jgi:hypothetical protein
MPNAAHVEAELFETSGFDGPRLVLYTGISRLPHLTVGWALFDSTPNNHPGHSSLPHTLREAPTDPDAAPALQFMAVDHQETDETAAETPSDHQTVRTLAGIASTAHLDHKGQPRRVGVGTEIYAYTPTLSTCAPPPPTSCASGSPSWIAGA